MAAWVFVMGPTIKGVKFDEARPTEKGRFCLELSQSIDPGTVHRSSQLWESIRLGSLLGVVHRGPRVEYRRGFL